MGDGVQFRSPYNYDTQLASDETAVLPGGPSLTVQSQSEDADLNVMLKRFGVTGKMPEVVRLPQYGDFSNVRDYQSAMNAIIEAEDNFLELTPEVRARFENNPQKLLDFVENPANLAELKAIFGEKNVPAVSRSNDGTPEGARVAAGAQGASGVGANGGNSVPQAGNQGAAG
jgi:phage internal scaffolding protein